MENIQEFKNISCFKSDQEEYKREEYQLYF